MLCGGALRGAIAPLPLDLEASYANAFLFTNRPQTIHRNNSNQNLCITQLSMDESLIFNTIIYEYNY